MTRTRLALLPLLLLPGLAGPGCTTGTETGNPPRAGVSFELVSSDEEHFTVGAGVGVNITTGRIGVQQLALTDCKTQAVTQVTTATTVDLRGGDDFEVPLQSICTVELSLAARDLDWSKLHSGAAPNLSLGLAGLTTSSAPLLVEDEAAPRVLFRPQTFEVKPGTELVLSLDVAKALSFAEVQQAMPNNDGAFVISSQENGSILTSIRQRWATSWSLYAVDGSGGRDLIAIGEAQ